MWPKLIDLLTQLNKAYDMLHQLGQQKRGALIVIDMQQVEELNAKEGQLTTAISRLEQQRQALLLQMLAENDDLKPDMQARDMIGHCPGTWRSSLASQYEALTKKVAEVQALSADNRVLVQAALQAVHYHLNRIGGTSVEPAYDQGGTEQGTQGHRNLDFQA
jgi:hypothetical protein